MRQFLLICIGGAIGTALRYLVSIAALRALGNAFPYGTFAVNLIGSFAISAVMFLGLERGAIHPDLRLVLTVGVLGGFTTYSSFNYETLRLLEAGTVGVALLNAGLTLFGCLGAGALGQLVARAL